MAACVLHNIAIDRNLPDIGDDPPPEDEEDEILPKEIVGMANNSYRNLMVQNYFT